MTSQSHTNIFLQHFSPITTKPSWIFFYIFHPNFVFFFLFFSFVHPLCTYVYVLLDSHSSSQLVLFGLHVCILGLLRNNNFFHIASIQQQLHTKFGKNTNSLPLPRWCTHATHTTTFTHQTMKHIEKKGIFCALAHWCDRDKKLLLLNNLFVPVFYVLTKLFVSCQQSV